MGQIEKLCHISHSLPRRRTDCSDGMGGSGSGSGSGRTHETHLELEPLDLDISLSDDVCGLSAVALAPEAALAHQLPDVH
eukprot:195499-Rhodomonas_salina.1